MSASLPNRAESSPSSRYVPGGGETRTDFYSPARISSRPRSVSRNLVLFVLVLGLILGFILLNLAVGTVPIPVRSVWAVLLGHGEGTSEVWQNIIWKSRFPQTLTALVSGIGLSVSGLQMQTIFRNPLAGPSELGISSGASLGVASIVLLSGSLWGTALSGLGFAGEMAVTLSAILGAGLVMVVILILSQKVRGNAVLLIMGVMIGYIATAIIGVMKFFSSDEDVRSYVVWGLGSFSNVTGDHLWFFAGMMTLLLPLAFLLIKPLNLLRLGDNYARSLGLNVRRARLAIIATACIYTAIVTAYCGPIVFLGLAVPHLCRTIFGTSDHRVLMPAVTLVGAALALICNLIARMPGFEGALPINSVTALIGAPIVISVLFGKRREEIN